MCSSVLIYIVLFYLYTCTLIYTNIDDKDDSGQIDNKEVKQMLQDIYGKEFEKNTYAKK